MPEPAPRPTRRYAAFLSYRHADNREEGRRWAEWLHQALETYEVPRDLAGKPNVRGQPVPASLYPVFRDEEELPADADLTNNIQRALENSDLLIVLCSPRACQSQFVADEIRYFKELGKSDRILALMLDGEPNADDPAKAALGVTPEMECFPEPLRFGVPVAQQEGSTVPAPIDWTRRTEPIAADVRPGNLAGQGYTSAPAYRAALEKAHAHSAAEIRRREKEFGALLELARLKLVAGALGLPLGQLRERDAVYRARKFRRLAAILGSLALLALIAAGVAVWQGFVAKQQQVRAEAGERAAVAARERAVASKKAADELIRFMQYDLRDTLDKLGALNMMDGINARIRRYHEEHPPEPGDELAQDKADRERTTALDQQGDILLARGQLVDALGCYHDSFVIRTRLAEKYPKNKLLLRDLAVSLSNLATAYEASGALDNALADHRDSLSFTRRAGDEQSGGAAVTLDKIGNIQKKKGDLDAALKSYQDGLAIRQGLAAKNPAGRDSQHDLSISFAKIGGVQELKGDLDAAFKSYQDSLAICRQLTAQDPANTLWQHSLAVDLETVGNIQKSKGKPATALQSYQDSLEAFQKLAAHDPANAAWQRDLATGLEKVASIQQFKDLPGALHKYQDSLAIHQKFAAQDPANMQWQRDISISLDHIGTVQQAQGDLPAALKSHQDSLAISRSLAAQDPANAAWQRDLAVCLEGIGDVQQAQRDLPAAFQSYTESLAISDALVAKAPTSVMLQLAVIYGERNLGDILYQQKRLEEARPHFERRRQTADHAAAEHPSDYSFQAERAHARWCIVDCIDAQVPANRETARQLLSEAAEILHALDKSGGLRRKQAEWLRGIEQDLEKLP